MRFWMMLLLAGLSPSLKAGNILLSNLDADYHAGFEPCALCFDPTASQDFIRTSVQWVRDGSPKPFLFVSSSIKPPFAGYFNNDPGQGIDGQRAFHIDGERGIKNSGYKPGVDYERHDAQTLAGALMNLSNYSAIVIGSDFGGILTSQELKILNSFHGTISDYIAGGGGLFAMAQTNDGIGKYDPVSGLGDPSLFDVNGVLLPGMGLLGAEQKWGFLPIPVFSDSSYGAYDGQAVLTDFGRRVGFTDAMMVGNVSHLYFRPNSGYKVISYTGTGQIANLAIVFTPEPATLGTIAVGLLAGAVALRRRNS